MLSLKIALRLSIRMGRFGSNIPSTTQAAFALERVRELAPKHPEWKQHEPFKSVITGNREAMSKFSEADWVIIVATTHTGMSTGGISRHRESVAGNCETIPV